MGSFASSLRELDICSRLNNSSLIILMSHMFSVFQLLQACMQADCSPFQAEIGKFRFLNELIKLVSPKYLGNLTSAMVKNKIIDLLMLWSEKYPKETKIKEAFDMLIKQGVVVSFC